MGPDTTYKFGFMPGSGANREDLRGGKRARGGRNMAKTTRVDPTVRMKKKIEQDVPIDFAGMDSSMASTIRGERTRRVGVGRALRPQAYTHTPPVMLLPGFKPLPMHAPTLRSRDTILGGIKLTPAQKAKADSMYNALKKKAKKGK